MALTEVNSKGIKDGAIVNADIADDTIAEAKLDVHAAPSGTDKFLGYTSNGMEWAVPTDTTTPADDSVTGAKLSVSLVQGDVLYGSGTDTLARLAKGTAGQSLVMNSGATAPEWGDSAAGATGAGSDKIFWENGQTVTQNYTITNNYNAGTFGPVTINNSVTVTVGDGETWTIV
jgi:hypothetical protein